jgi:hypothetical protein
MSWAKVPTMWLRPLKAEKATQRLAEHFDIDPDADEIYPLSLLTWRKDGASSMAALSILIALAIGLNVTTRGKTFAPGSARPKQVSVTFDDLQKMTGFSRGSVASGVRLLQQIGAIIKVKVGRASLYELSGIDVNGHWAQLPQSKLLRADNALVIKRWPRTKVTLAALKIYLTLIALRHRNYDTSSISFTALTKWTGVRRAELHQAIGYLQAIELVAISDEKDDRHLIEKDRSNRYRVLGLGPVTRQVVAA